MTKSARTEPMSASIASISRHRIVIDGDGVRTLVVMQGCPLRCRYCINPFAVESNRYCKHYTPEQLMAELMPDNLYFLATKGGVTFGGGEPALQSDFIAQFHAIIPKAWTIHIETSLNVPQHHVEQLASIVQRFVVDIKDMNPTIYHRYTGKDNHSVKNNLQWLVSQGMAEQIVARVPKIPEYNTNEDIRRSIEELQATGIKHFDPFTYRIPQVHYKPTNNQ